MGIPIQCNKNTEICEAKPIEYEEKINAKEMIADLIETIQEHIYEGHGDEELQGLIDHINGYPKIKDYTYS